MPIACVFASYFGRGLADGGNILEAIKLRRPYVIEADVVYDKVAELDLPVPHVMETFLQKVHFASAFSAMPSVLTKAL